MQRLPADRPGRNIFYLLHQHVHCRFRFYDKVPDQHTDGNDDPIVRQRSQYTAKVKARRNKSHVSAGEEQHQSHIGIDDAVDDTKQRLFFQMQGNELEDSEKDGDRHNGLGQILHIFRQRIAEHAA